MPQDSQTSPQIVNGLIVKDSTLAPALCFLAVILLATPAGAMAVHAWWTGELFFGINVAWYGAALGFAGIAGGLLSIASLINTFLQKNYLVIGDDCFQQVQYGKVIVQIPFDNISRLEFGEHSLLGKFIKFFFINENDRRTTCSKRLKPVGGDSSFEIADAGWCMPLEALHAELESRLPGQRGPGRASMFSATRRHSMPAR